MLRVSKLGIYKVLRNNWNTSISNGGGKPDFGAKGRSHFDLYTRWKKLKAYK